jgi:hypothetical protein
MNAINARTISRLWPALSLLVIVDCQYFGQFLVQYKSDLDPYDSILIGILNKYSLQNMTKKSGIKNTEILFTKGFDSTNPYVGYYFVKRKLDTLGLIDGCFRYYGPNEQAREFKKITAEIKNELSKRYGSDSFRDATDAGGIPLEWDKPNQ